MSDSGWSSVKKRNRNTRVRAREQNDAERFQKLKTETPHLLLPEEARQIALQKNIANLVYKFKSPQWIDFQRRGWRYVDVYTPEQQDQMPRGMGYQAMPLHNRYDDVVLFERVQT